jgi:hypothetical protein
MVRVNESLSTWFMISIAQDLNSASVSPLPSKVEHSVLTRGKNILVPRGIGVVRVRTSPSTNGYQEYYVNIAKLIYT